MEWGLLRDAPLAVQLHLATVLPAFAIGTWQMFGSTRGSPAHRAWGKAFLVLMAATAVISWFVRAQPDGGLSPIHLLIPLTLFGVVQGWRRARRGDARGHRRAMIALYVGGFVIAGAFTLVPGRLLHRLLIG